MFATEPHTSPIIYNKEPAHNHVNIPTKTPPYWCLFMINDPGNPDHNLIVRISEMCIMDEIFPEFAYDDSLGKDWYADLKPGLYYIELHPWENFSGNDYGLNIISVTCLYLLPTFVALS